ncbi:MAG: SIR2 family protein, partial [Rhodospirillaceae bacterium]|nr:SIR2 family protein [Rhodospirillaceae bacterium]
MPKDMKSHRENEICAAKIMMLVGAGISIPIGIPAMREIYADFLERSKSNITDSEKRMCEFLTNELGVRPDLEEFLLAANTILDFPSSSLATFVEKSVSPKTDSKSLQGYRRRVTDRAERVQAIRKRILEFLSRACFKFNQDRSQKIFGEFVHAVSDVGCPVFSTNYDFSLEHVARKKDIAIEDNFVASGERQIWNPEIHFPTGDALTLIKLHGSVTWYADSEGEIERIESKTDINSAGKDVNQLIIFPTRFKDIYDQHFFALYSHFLAVLSVAKILVVAGHSLRDDYLRAAIIEQLRKGNMRLIVIDPNFPSGLPSELGPAPIGKSNLITHVPYRFEEFSDDLAQMIRHCEPT